MFNVEAQGREAGLLAKRSSGATGYVWVSLVDIAAFERRVRDQTSPQTKAAPADANGGTTMNKRMPNPRSSPSSARELIPVESIS